ncbi:Uncharacterized protein FKW44_020110, partial [Caligus rogercresseyi]
MELRPSRYGYASSTVYDVVKAFKASGDVSRKLHDKSGTGKRTFLASLRRSVTANPGIPMSVLAKKREQGY